MAEPKLVDRAVFVMGVVQVVPVHVRDHSQSAEEAEEDDGEDC